MASEMLGNAEAPLKQHWIFAKKTIWSSYWFISSTST